MRRTASLTVGYLSRCHIGSPCGRAFAKLDVQVVIPAHTELSPGLPRLLMPDSATDFAVLLDGVVGVVVPGSTMPQYRYGDAVVVCLAGSGMQSQSTPPRGGGATGQGGAICPFPSRFTPTCVGTTHRPTCASPTTSVHPHVRGDNEGELPQAEPGLGSPPRAWGQRRDGAPGGRAHRFTPTCVGTAC